MSQDKPVAGQTFTEKIETAGDQLVSTVTSLLHDSSVRRVTIRNEQGRELFSLPMNAGIAVGGIAVLAAPTLAAIGAIAALVTRVSLDIERTDVTGTEAMVVDATPADGEDDASGSED